MSLLKVIDRDGGKQQVLVKVEEVLGLELEVKSRGGSIAIYLKGGGRHSFDFTKRRECLAEFNRMQEILSIPSVESQYYQSQIEMAKKVEKMVSTLLERLPF